MDGSTVPVDYLPSATPARSAAGRPNANDDANGDANGSDAGGDGGAPSFRAVLSALNPLQYLPVVGTIYRAATGDTIPEGLRMAGSFLFSGLTGGPVGLLLNVATTLAEKITGVDPEAIAREVAGGLGLGRPGGDAHPPVREAGSLLAAPAPLPGPASASSDTADAAPFATVAAQPLPVLSDAQRRAGLASYARFAVA